jgi:hypothetical protein
VKGRTKLAGGEGVEGAETGSEFGGGQAALAAGGRSLIPKHAVLPLLKCSANARIFPDPRFATGDD